MTTSGLIVSDDQIIRAELEALQSTVAALGEIIAEDKATLQMVTKAEPLLSIVPEKHVVAIYTPKRGLVVAAGFES